GDLNGDGNPDLAVADLISPIAGGPKNQMLPGHVSVLLGKGDGTFGARTEFPVNRGRSPHPGTSSSAVAIGDVTGDGKPDLAVTLTGASSAGRVAILRGKGNGSFAPPSSVPVGTQPVCSDAERRTGHCPRASVALGRLNSDGRLDLAVTNFGTNRVSVMLKR
ncbi:MAG TPA: VCBS repeat-containing protein, partial [Solirubrobacterales bacterium]